MNSSAWRLCVCVFETTVKQTKTSLVFVERPNFPRGQISLRLDIRLNVLCCLYYCLYLHTFHMSSCSWYIVVATDVCVLACPSHVWQYATEIRISTVLIFHTSNKIRVRLKLALNRNLLFNLSFLSCFDEPSFGPKKGLQVVGPRTLVQANLNTPSLGWAGRLGCT